MKLSNEISLVREENTVLRNQIELADSSSSVERSEIEALNDEFSRRIKDWEKKAKIACRERDVLKAELAELSSHSVKETKLLSEQLKESEEKAEALLQEGEKLSKRHLVDSNNLKKLKTKDKENEKTITQLRCEISSLQSSVTFAESKAHATNEQLRETSDSLEEMKKVYNAQVKDISRLKKELEGESGEKDAYLAKNAALRNEIEKLRNDSSRAKTEAEEIALSSKISAKEELKFVLKESEEKYNNQLQNLQEQVVELQRNNLRLSKQHGRVEENLRYEIDELQKRLQDADVRNQELTESVSAATRPLLRQIQNLQSLHATQAENWERSEMEMNAQVNELKAQSMALVERERISTGAKNEIEGKFRVLQKELNLALEEKAKLEGEMEVIRNSFENQKLELLRLSSREESEKETLKKDNLKLRQSVEELKASLLQTRERLDSECKSTLLLRDSLRAEEIEKSKLAEKVNSLEGELVGAGTKIEDSRRSSISEQGRLREVEDGSHFSISSFGSGGSVVVLEKLQQNLRSKESELIRSKRSLESSEIERKELAEEVMRLASRNTELEKLGEQNGQLRNEVKDLNTRYEAVLQMYGEMEEKAEEYRLDLLDVKLAYKGQIEALASEIERLRDH